MQYINTQTYQSRMGQLTIGSFHESVVLCDWSYRKSRPKINRRLQDYFQAEFKEQTDSIITKTTTQLDEYFNGDRQKFELPLQFAGTDFQQRVWQELLTIPFGETKSYLELAQLLGDEQAIRAVATANGANAHAIIVPCHRIVGKNGDLVGYAGGLPTKKKLLHLEQQVSQLNLFE